jgi:hypothetical protein
MNRILFIIGFSCFIAMMRYSIGLYVCISVRDGLMLAIVDILLFRSVIYFIISIYKQVSKYIHFVLWL